MSSDGSDKNEVSNHTPLRLETRGIEKRFGPTIAVAGVDLSVADGEVRALIGENGAGKSTFVGVLSGVVPHDRGEIYLEGRSYRPANPRRAREAGVVMVHQELALASHLTVAENVFLGMEPVRRGFLRRGVMESLTAKALAELQHGDISPDTPVRSLSVAARQIVEIARALVLDARVLILDEPTSSLSQRDVEILFALIRRLKNKGLSIIYISHFLEEVWDVADSYTVLRDGRSVREGRIEDTTVAEVVRAMVGRSIDEMFPPRGAAKLGDVVLEVDGISSEPLPKTASFSLRRGEILGIAGLMGAGRTELLRAVFGLAPVRAGSIRVGVYEGFARPELRWRQGLGLSSEDRQGEGLALSRSVGFNISLSRLDVLLRPKRIAARAQGLIDRLGIASKGPSQAVSELSGGNQQKAALARLLYQELDVLLLDEPTRGIDVGSKVQIYEIVAELKAAGKAIVIVSSYLPELLGLSDRIAVMSRGRLSEARPATELDEEAILREAVS